MRTPPAPVAVAQNGGGDWRLPKGPAPPRPPTMPKWFKWQPKAEEWCIPGPHNRHHSKRIAAIVVNYNMVERANSIAEGIKKHVKWPVDVIVVDNGSDLKESPPSPHTAIRLEANVQTTNGWQMGIEYAKALGHVSDEPPPRCTNQMRACVRMYPIVTHTRLRDCRRRRTATATWRTGSGSPPPTTSILRGTSSRPWRSI